MATPETRRQLLAAVAACEDKKGEDTRILSLDPVDSGLADFFLITSATNDRQVVAIADEIEMRLKKEFGVYPASVEGRRQAEWILLDYVDIVIHVFLAEKRAFYDIERLRKSARTLTPVEVEAEHEAALSAALADALRERTLAVRSHRPSAKAKKTASGVTAGKSPATRAKSSSKGDLAATAKPARKAAKKAASKPGAKPARKAISASEKSTVNVTSKPAAAPVVISPAKKAGKKAAKKAPIKAAKKAPAKAAKKVAKRSKGK